MSAIEPAFLYLLSHDSGVSDLIAARVYIGSRPQDERRSCLVIGPIDEDYPHTLAGDLTYVPGGVEIDCRGATQQEARTLSLAARAALDGKAGTIADCDVMLIVADSSDSSPVPVEGEGIAMFEITTHYSFWYRP